MNNKPVISILLAVLAMFSFSSNADQKLLNEIMQKVENDMGSLTGYSIHVINDNGSFNLTKGKISPDGNDISPANLFRIASVSKTFVAATALRLIEDGQLDLDAPLADLLAPNYLSLLESDGYATKQITLKQLLNHTSGLFDHAQSPAFFEQINDDPLREWTREEQIRGCIDWGDPVGEPGEHFSYSDSGYVLLGHIIERASKLPLPIAVRRYLNLSQNQIRNVFWERGDSIDVPHHLRVHQFLDGKDTFDWDPSMDLYGGGGLVTTPAGMALFFRKLFSGEIFRDEKTLQLMISDDGIPLNSPYRLGVFVERIDDFTVYEHSGFWGTSVMFKPDSKTTIAGAVTRQQDYKPLRNILKLYLQELSTNAKAATKANQ